MRWSRTYLRTRRAREVAGLRPPGNTAKDIELLVLQQQLAVLQRQVGQPKLDPADRVLLVTLRVCCCPRTASYVGNSAVTGAQSETNGINQRINDDTDTVNEV